MSEIDDSVDYVENYMEQDDFSDNESESTDLKIADKRAHHNALERKRRDHIKDSFSSLRDAIPTLVGEKINSHKASRAQILKKAAEYIDLMRRKNNDHQKDIDTLKKENKLLEEKIRALEELKCAGQLKNSNSKSQQSTNNARTRSKSLIVTNVNSNGNSTGNSNGSSSGNSSAINGSNSNLSTNSSSTVSSSLTTNSSNLNSTNLNNNDGTSILQNRVKSESSFEANSDDSENLLDNHNTETVVQIVKKGVVSSSNCKLNTSNGTTLLVNGTIIKQATNSQQTHSLLTGPPNKRKKIIIAANPTIISK